MEITSGMKTHLKAQPTLLGAAKAPADIDQQVSSWSKLAESDMQARNVVRAAAPNHALAHDFLEQARAGMFFLLFFFSCIETFQWLIYSEKKQRSTLLCPNYVRV